MIYKRDINKKLFPLVLLFSGVIFMGMGPFSPAYFVIVLQTFLILIYFSFIKIKRDNLNLSIVICLFYFLIEIFVHPKGDIHVGILYCLNLLTLLFFVLLFPNINNRNIVKYSMTFIHGSIVLMFIELIIRLRANSFNISEFKSPLFFVKGFYVYKFKSILGKDTNFTATYILSVLCFLNYLSFRFNKKYIIEKLLLVFFLFFTFCRSSWLSSFVSFFLLKFLFSKQKLNKKRLFCVAAIVIIFLLSALTILASDESFQTKILIWNETLRFLTKMPMNTALWGLGYLGSYDFIGWLTAHALIPTLIMDTGVVGLVLYFAIWKNLLKKSDGWCLYILLPIFIFGLSFIQNLIPYVYMFSYIIIKCEENIKKTNGIAILKKESQR
jgi:hypothetical protein